MRDLGFYITALYMLDGRDHSAREIGEAMSIPAARIRRATSAGQLDGVQSRVEMRGRARTVVYGPTRAALREAANGAVAKLRQHFRAVTPGSDK